MTLDDSYNELEQLDTEAFIQQLNISGYHFWPLFRFHLLLKFKSPNEYLAFKPATLNPSSSFLKSLKEDFSVSRKINQQLKSLPKLPENALLFISDPAYYTDKIDQGLYNRHIDPYIGILKEENYPVFKIEFTDKNTEKSSQYYYPVSFFLSTFFNDFKGKKKRNLHSLNNYKGKITQLCSSHSVEINIDSFCDQAFQILERIQFFKLCLAKLKPKLVFLPCFYEVHKLALVIACNELSIPVIDIQHGKQGVKHHMYYGWKHVPVNSFNMLPTHFWNWGSMSAITISQRFNSVAHRPKCIDGGNPWLSLWIHNKINLQPNPLQKRKLENNYSKTILFALQPVFTNGFLTYINALANQHKDWLLLLRMHPVMEKDKDQFIHLSEIYPNVEIENSSKLPLYQILPLLDFCITAWSSVAIEALYFGVHSIIIHENGAEIFKDYIREQKFTYCPTVENCVSIIGGPALSNTADDFINIDYAHIKKTLLQLVNE